ncbi:MAG: PGPGW domain-containing protein [Candidatus Nanopelagicaceae bacterium]
MIKYFKGTWRKLPHPVRWIMVATVGATLVVLGIAFLVLPGPGIPLIIAGLAILATEFTWAEIWLNRTKHHVSKAVKRVRKKN